MAIYEIKEENGKFIVINEDEKAKPEKFAIQAKSHIDNFYKHCLRWANSSYQTKSWLITIGRTSSDVKEIMGLSESIKQAVLKINPELESIYLGCKAYEQREHKLDIKNDGVSATFSTVEKIADIALVLSWIMSTTLDDYKDEVMSWLCENSDFNYDFRIYAKKHGIDLSKFEKASKNKQ